MKILYDHQIFTMQKFGGISNYFFELHKSTQYNSEIITKYSNNVFIKNKNILDKFEHNKYINFIYRKFVWKMNENYCNKIIKQQDFDLLHPTYFNTYFLKKIGNKPFIITIHDTIHEIFPSLFNKKDNTIEKRKELIYKAKRIIAISENTKKDIINYYDIPSDKIDVIYHGYDQYENPINKLIPNLPKKYILFVGNRNRYKNFKFLCQAIADILKNNKDLYLVCSGYSFNLDEYIFLEKLGINKKVVHYFFNKDSMYSAYNNAIMFIYPSLYEGFGIPILDAFYARCPTILSNASCFPEIAKNGALYFDIGDKISLQEKVHTLLTNNKVKEDLINKAQIRLADFSWENTRKETYQSYCKTLNNN